MINSNNLIKNDNNSFKNALINLTKEYRYNKSLNNDNIDDYIIKPEDFKNLSEYEKRTIKTIGKMYNLFNKKVNYINYNDLVSMLDELAKDRNDAEKQYLISLFFPERIRHMNVLHPFPVPTYSFIQKQNGRITPNNTGNFSIQCVCPLLLDSTVNDSSVIYINTNNALDGINKDATKNHYVPQNITACVPGAFNAYVLQCFKLSVEYVGRPDIQSGFFGGAYFVSTEKSLEPDVNASIFNYIDDSINAVKIDSKDGLNVIYYPLDTSYTHFMNVNQDNIDNHSMNTSLRLSIYGSSLPNGNDAPNCINYSICAIYNVIPSQAFSELLPVDYYIQSNEKFSLVDSAQFISSTKLSSFPNSKTGEIERLLELPKSIKIDAINKLLSDIKLYGNNSKYKNVLDVLKPLIGNSFTKAIKLDTKMLESQLPKMDTEDDI